MSSRRKLLITVLLLATLAVLGLFLYRRSAQPPELARLLPEGDILVYANPRPTHLWDMAKSRPVQVEGEYQRFIDQTGIQFERDLDEAAMSRRDTPDGKDTESSEILAGRFDRKRLETFLEGISSQRESYRDRLLYVIPHEGHTVRVCVLDAKRVAITNMASADAMHEIINGTDKQPGGPSLLQRYYRRVPLGSLGWIIVRSTGSQKRSQLPAGWSFDFLENTVTVGSARYKGDLLLRADVIAGSEDDAKRIMEAAADFLAMYQTVAQTVGARGTDADVKAAIDSIQVQRNKNVAVFTATLSPQFLKKLVSEAGSEAAASESSPSPAPIPPAQKRRKHRRQPKASPTPPAG